MTDVTRHDDHDTYPGGWFGESWASAVRTLDELGTHICDNVAHHRVTPVGQPCFDCGWPIVDGDRGLIIPHYYAPGRMRLTAYHIACFRREVGLRDLPPDVTQPFAVAGYPGFMAHTVQHHARPGWLHTHRTRVAVGFLLALFVFTLMLLTLALIDGWTPP